METLSPWHSGELTVQLKTGNQERMAQIGPKVIRPFMSDQHRKFFEQQPMIILGAEDHKGDIWATALFGKSGFISTPDERSMLINATLPATSPLFNSLRIGSRLGLLGIDLLTKRRNRLNGVITSHSEKQMGIEVLQSFGNCPKYIQVKHSTKNPRYGQFGRKDFASLSEANLAFIQQADTFFIATGFNDNCQSNNRGFDVSHRGGEPGFIRIDSNGRLLVPDYSGNRFFNTLGNLQINPQAGLLFFDFIQGHSLHLSGTAEVIWRHDRPDLCGEAERMLRFTVSKGCMNLYALPYLFQQLDRG